MLLLLNIKTQGICQMRLATCLALLLAFTTLHAQTLKVTVPEYNPPFIMSSGRGFFFGFDADIISEICRRLSVECKLLTRPYSEVFSAVKKVQADLAIGAITISLNRDKQFLFSLPYLRSFGQYIVKTKSELNSVNDFAGRRFGVADNSVYLAMLKNQYGSKIQISTYDFHTQMLDALYNGDVEILLLDKATADYWVANSDNIYRLLGDQIPYGAGYGILAAKGQEKLINKINNVILSMQADGTYIRIYSTYFNSSLY